MKTQLNFAPNVYNMNT